MIKYVLFDLDETLYPTTNGLMQAVALRMREYIADKYQLTLDEAYELQKRYWNQYGTTLRGLYLERQLDPIEYLAYVHAVDLAQFIAPDPQLRAVLEQIPQEKMIITNADAPHARRVLNQLGIAEQFTRIFDVVFMEYECKPSLIVYRRVLDALGARGDECVLVEDMARNLPAARQLGFKTILVYSPECPPAADVCLPDIYQVADAIAQLAETFLRSSPIEFNSPGSPVPQSLDTHR